MSHLNLTGKDKSARIPLPYHEKVGRRRRKYAIIAGVALLVIAGVVVALGSWKAWSAPLRPVHSSHASFENDCSQCHDAGKPTNSSNALSGVLSSQGKASDKLCMNCHMGQEGQEHHKNMKDAPSTAATCAACHKDHQGRGAFISRVADAKCTCCHSDLKSHTEGALTYAEKITSFEKDHPEFKVLGAGGERVELSKARDPGKLRFNHQMHLTKGIIGNWTYERIPEKDGMRKRYLEMQGKDAKVGDLIQLDCASCHALSASDDARKTGLARTSGDYVLPVTYEQHCKACHPLTFSPADNVKEVEIPHHSQPDQVKDFLSGVFARNVVKAGGKDVKLKQPFAGLVLPGDNLDREAREKELRKVIERAGDLAWEAQAQKAEHVTTCMLCHHKEAVAGKTDRIAAVKVPEVWFPHAKFSHQAHRTVDCAGCHGGKDEAKNKYGRPSVYHSQHSDDVLLPPINNCLECHSSARTVDGKKQGGVRHECVTCHSYHHGDAPLAGRGAKARGIETRRAVEEWMSPGK